MMGACTHPGLEQTAFPQSFPEDPTSAAAAEEKEEEEEVVFHPV